METNNIVALGIKVKTVKTARSGSGWKAKNPLVGLLVTGLLYIQVWTNLPLVKMS